MIETFPLIDDTPFPTLYWLTCARANHEIGRLESGGWMELLNERLNSDEAFADAFSRAQHDYIARRDGLHPLGSRAGGVGGGPLHRIKCLHAHYAHHVVCRCNPVGEWIDEHAGVLVGPPPCVSPPGP